MCHENFEAPLFSLGVRTQLQKLYLGLHDVLACRRLGQCGATSCCSAAGVGRRRTGKGAAPGCSGPRAPHRHPQRRHSWVLRGCCCCEPLQWQLRCASPGTSRRTDLADPVEGCHTNHHPSCTLEPSLDCEALESLCRYVHMITHQHGCKKRGCGKFLLCYLSAAVC